VISLHLYYFILKKLVMNVKLMMWALYGIDI